MAGERRIGDNTDRTECREFIYLGGGTKPGWRASQLPCCEEHRGLWIIHLFFLRDGRQSKRDVASKRVDKVFPIGNGSFLLLSINCMHAAGKRDVASKRVDKVFPIGNGSFRVVQIYDVTFRLDTERKSYTCTCLLLQSSGFVCQVSGRCTCHVKLIPMRWFK